MSSISEAIKYNYKAYRSILEVGAMYRDEECHIEFNYTISDLERDKVRSLIPFKIVDKGKLKELFTIMQKVHDLFEFQYQKTRMCDHLEASEIITMVQKECCAVNCKAYAKVLQNTLAAYGYIAKMVFCMPVDLDPKDCHVMVQAYCEENEKWVALDAALNAYYTNENGDVLDISEIRRLLILQKKVNVMFLTDKFISDNRLEQIKRKKLEENVVMYLVKNMYRFSMMQSNEEHEIEVEYHLVPYNYIREQLNMNYYVKNASILHKTIFLSNPKEFWKKPKESIL